MAIIKIHSVSSIFRDRAERHCFLPRLCLFFSPFLFPPIKRGRKKRRMNNQSRSQKQCLSARSFQRVPFEKSTKMPVTNALMIAKQARENKGKIITDDRAERHDLLSRFLLIHSSFLPPFLFSREDKRENNNQSRGQNNAFLLDHYRRSTKFRTKLLNWDTMARIHLSVHCKIYNTRINYQSQDRYTS